MIRKKLLHLAEGAAAVTAIYGIAEFLRPAPEDCTAVMNGEQPLLITLAGRKAINGFLGLITPSQLTTPE